MKIITHDGFFHADEVFAIALLHQVMGVCPVERRRKISQEEFENPDIWVLDVGMRFEPLLRNIDHHHDKELEATNMQVLHILLAIGKLTSDQHEELEGPFLAISDIDRTGYVNANGFQVNSLIRSFNNLPHGFDLSLHVAIKYIQSCFDTVSKIASSRQIWDDAQIIGGIVRVCSAYPVHWKRYKEEPFVVFREFDGTWKLVSIDSATYPIHSTGDEIFIHNEKFIAVYKTMNKAVDAARMSWRLAEINNRVV
jgi:hypothetical protein